MAVVFLSAIGAVLAGQWRRSRPLLGRLDAPVLLASWALVLAGITATFRSLAGRPGRPGRRPAGPAMRVFYLGQLGKYRRHRLAGRHPDAPRPRLPVRREPQARPSVFMLLLVGTGLLVGLPVIPLLGRDAADSTAGWRWSTPLFALALSPAPAQRGHRRGPAGSQAAADAGAADARRRPRGAGWAVRSWVCYGGQVYLLARTLGRSGGALLWLQCTGAFAAAFVSGPLLLVVPARAGIREAALLLLLGSTVTAPVAAGLIAVVSRLLFVGGDLAWSGVAVVAARRAVQTSWASSWRRT